MKENIYSYNTKEFDGINPFDNSTTGISFYDQFLTDPSYMEDYKNLTYSIVKMSPREYFNECSKLLGKSPSYHITQVKKDHSIIKYLSNILNKDRKTFPLTFLNFTNSTQEGRHRMYVVGELLGWDKKFPVMIVDWADPEQERKKKEAQLYNLQNEIILAINKVANNLSNIEYKNIEELITDFKYYLKYNFYIDNVSITLINNSIEFHIQGVEYKLPIGAFNLQEWPKDYLTDYDLDNVELELKRMGLK